MYAWVAISRWRDIRRVLDGDEYFVGLVAGVRWWRDKLRSSPTDDIPAWMKPLLNRFRTGMHPRIAWLLLSGALILIDAVLLGLSVAQWAGATTPLVGDP
jgi:hypothetical protein